MSESEKVSLPFDLAKQRALLGHCIINSVFFQQCNTRVKPDWFEDPALAKVYKALQSFWAEYKRSPTSEELKGFKEIMQWDPAERGHLQNTINISINGIATFGADIFKNELTCWLGTRIYQEGVIASKRAYDAKKYDECFTIISKKVKEMNESKFVDDISKSFSDPEKLVANMEHRFENALTWGVKEMDDAMMPEGLDAGPKGESGGFFLGDTTLVLAPSNVGKSSTLITVARHNIMRGRDVLWFTHEGVDEDLQTKMVQAVLQVDMVGFKDMMKTDEGRQHIHGVMKLVERRLTYIPWNHPGMTVEELIPIIERRQEERIAKYGKGFDLLVDDYPGKLSTQYAQGGKMEQRNMDAKVYDNFVQLGLKHKFHVLAAIQTNREGSKVNRDDTRLLTQEDVRECWDTMTMATNVITINRDQKAASRNRVTFLVSKSRSSRTNRAVVCRSNYAACLTHSDDMGATWYYGTNSLSDSIDTFMDRFKGQQIPHETIADAG